MEAIRHLPDAWEIGTDPLRDLTDTQVLEALHDWRSGVSVHWTGSDTTLAICFLNQLEKRYAH